MKKIKAVHYSILSNSNNNAGDNLLFESVRKIIEHFFDGKIEWDIQSMWNINNSSQINSNDCDFVLFGGGGIILPDQLGVSNLNNTGWMLDIRDDDYKNIKIPYFAAAIGYNWFRSSNINPSKASKNLNFFIENANFVGFRNKGSLNKVQKLTGNNYSNVGILPFTTTLNKFYFKKIKNIKTKISDVAINIGCDRLEQRNFKLEDLLKLNKSLDWMSKNGYNLTYLAHKDVDLKAVDYLSIKSVKNISRLTNRELLKTYTEFDLVFGGRGHSLMIPYGLDIPIVSITTHDKQKFFMNDIKYNNCNLEMDQISSESFLNFVKDLDKKIAAQPNSNVEYKKNGYKLWKNFVRNLENCL